MAVRKGMKGTTVGLGPFMLVAERIFKSRGLVNLEINFPPSIKRPSGA